ncbi:MAG: deoxyribodipyrimidine photo-lyase, partial [Actinobacteria bacterium]|nr:deoxyribodipyrimidine photo-lyase [Actinomycetota bacterium]
MYRYGDPLDVIPALVAEVGASAVYAARDFAPYGSRRDAAVTERLSARG